MRLFSVKEWEEGEAGEAAGEVAGEAAGEVAGEESETDQNISIESMAKDQGKNIEYWIIYYLKRLSLTWGYMVECMPIFINTLNSACTFGHHLLSS